MTSSTVPTRDALRAVPFVVGAGVFALLQVFFSATWDTWFRWQQVDQAWWLNSQKSVVITMVVVSCAAAGLLSLRRARVSRDALLMLAGLVLAVAVVLFVQGPGNLWPVVIVLGAALLGLAVGLGAGVAAAIRRRRGVESGV